MTRIEEKHQSRLEDQRRLDSKEITKEQLSKENYCFGSLNIISCVIVNRRYRINDNDPGRTS